MSQYLRFAGQDAAAQKAALEAIVRDTPLLMRVLAGLRELDLPDCLLVAGALYNSVWNVLTGREALRGVNDIDICYFDASDLSYEAEDRVIRRAEKLFGTLPIPVQVRNQARVHLWFPQKFGIDFSPLSSSTEALERYASRAHSVAVRLERDDSMSVVAPFGLDEIFSFRLLPNRALDNSRTHDLKARRAQANWPELTVEFW